MLEFCARDFCQASNFIGQFCQQVRSGQHPSYEGMRIVLEELAAIHRQATILGLVSTLAQIERVRQLLPDLNTYGAGALAMGMMEVATRFTDELEGRKLYIVALERNAYLASNRFAQSAMERFPDAVPDMDEAAKCFAFERATACIFHLMRVVEHAIKAIADFLEIRDPMLTWEPVIRKIDAELKLDYSKRQFKGDQNFIAGASSHLQAVKTAWRNPTMHVDPINTMEHAKEIYDATCGLMRHLGDNLPKKKQGIVQAIRGRLGA